MEKSITSLLTNQFIRFINSQRFSGILLLLATIVSLFLANSISAEGYHHFWSEEIKLSFSGRTIGMSPEHFINEILMSVFFLLVGLEIKREFLNGELSGKEKASLPIAAALGGMIFPALIYISINYGTDTFSGWGIPMATDIAFAIGILSLLGKRIPEGLKILLTALAVVDDLGAVIVIALFYTKGIALMYLGYAAVVVVVMLILNRFNVKSLLPYLLLGVVLWLCIYNSGIHSTISGVILAACIPYSKTKRSPLTRLENILHTPVNFLVMPLFAMANTAINISGAIGDQLLTRESVGIAAGLVIGKPLGITLFIWLAIKAGISKLPSNVNFKEIIATGFLGGIGFTMSIFISLLAFTNEENIINAKLMILISSFVAGTIGFMMLKKYADAKT